MDAAQLAAVIQEVIARLQPILQPAPPEQGRQHHFAKRTIFDKGFSRLEKFAQGEGAWVDWSFDFKVALGSQSVEMKDTLEFIERSAVPLTVAQVRAISEVHANAIGLEKLNTELYEVLVLNTDGEAKLMVKATEGSDGGLAWYKLYSHYNKKTLARALRGLKGVIYPPKIKDMGQLITGIMEWESRWRMMEKESSTMQIPIVWKMAAFLELCPDEVQDVIFQNIEEIGEDYNKLKNRVVSWVGNKVQSRSNPVPMDIGNVQDQEEIYEEVDVDAIGSSMQCFNCQGWGHSARNCPSHKATKGGGKGGNKGGKTGWGANTKGYTKGSSKGDWSSKGGDWSNKGGDSKGGKGGYQGECWKCGKVGHKQSECRGGKAIGAHAIGEEQDDEEVGVGTVWTVASIDMIQTSNRYEVLNDDEDDDGDVTDDDVHHHKHHHGEIVEKKVVDIGSVEEAKKKGKKVVKRKG